MGREDLSFHETMDCHELLNAKTVALLKSKMMQGIVFDEDLRALIEKNVQLSINDIKELQRLYAYTNTQ
ncbi:similar to spore coat protein [Alteribacillus persepolensis]|uniref:Similar to spore coat protein n=1 Tax=Alteribacillus persepolensis TaxID=568899 RepID=A0A1G8EF91_9BACI|nr:spore coat protein [Alteribacillus persepolensis]SDH68450.1 similar to spore coat protein [Alteribacillus persepolensis]